MSKELTSTKSKKPLLLCILDGWGIGDDANPSNAISKANSKNYDRFLKQYPNSTLQTSGLAVGLPKGQIGNSEVGHMSIGSGRVIFQDLPKINNAISDGSLKDNQHLQNLILDLKKNNQTCHLMGLFSDGGVHSHIDHINYLNEILQQQNITTSIHAFLDGRDVAQKSALKYLQDNPNIKTISGRYYAMDRDHNWDRIKLSYDAIISGSCPNFANSQEAINDSYQNNISDEFIKPCKINNYDGIKDGDAIIFCNFRADRARQLSDALINPDFSEFKTKKLNLSHKICFTKYSNNLDHIFATLFPAQEINNSLGQIIADNNLTQLRLAETEKYAHVTFFFSCGQEEPYQNEDRILVKSPNVATYDLQPEMSAPEVGTKLRQAINSNKYDLIIVNYANPDMVGHSGNFKQAIKAVEVIDKELGLLEQEILKNNGQMLITADHGNIECMLDDNNKPHTSHTTNLVPLILITKDHINNKLQDGSLQDIAPTILNLLSLDKPIEMTGKNLLS